MSLRIEKATKSLRSQCLYPREMIGSKPIKRRVRKPYLSNPSLTDQGLILPNAPRKYPYQTHLKRFPVYDALNFSYFMKYAEKPFEKRNLFETMHMLPFRGVGFNFWRETKGIADWNRKNAIKAFNRFAPATQKTFIPQVVSFKERPWRAKVYGSLTSNGVAMRSDINRPLAADKGHWMFSKPSFADQVPSKIRPIMPASHLFNSFEIPAIQPRIGKIEIKKVAGKS
eukprot:GDKJ01009097.1.p1 GENE.GDKJ01009097.1~~GDKJ01009097.1.p1  ORF type:complete len:235 (+),score=23.44 GDKJ01009097.1:25-705(+)